MCVCVCVLVAQLCLTLCDPTDCSPPGFSVHGILQARILQWIAIPFSPGIEPVSLTSLALAVDWFFTVSVTWKVPRQTIGNGYRQMVKENWAWVSEEPMC